MEAGLQYAVWTDCRVALAGEPDVVVRDAKVRSTTGRYEAANATLPTASSSKSTAGNAGASCDPLRS